MARKRRIENVSINNARGWHAPLLYSRGVAQAASIIVTQRSIDSIAWQQPASKQTSCSSFSASRDGASPDVLFCSI